MARRAFVWGSPLPAAMSWLTLLVAAVRFAAHLSRLLIAATPSVALILVGLIFPTAASVLFARAARGSAGVSSARAKETIPLVTSASARSRLRQVIPSSLRRI